MNTISTESYRRKYRMASFAKLLRNALVAEAICEVDRGDAKTIDSPYGSQPAVTVQSIAGTYSPAAFTLTDDTLTVADEFIVSEHIYDFEKVLTNFDLFASRIDEQNYAVKAKIDQYVLNNLCEDGTGSYTTAADGFTKPGNINKIVADLTGKVSGYADVYKGLYIVIEQSDVTGFMQAQMANGFSFADSALKNGFFMNYGGWDLYVVQDSTFVDDTYGSKTWTNDGHRVAGVKKTSTYAAPRGVQYEEKGVTGKTGMETVTFGYIGHKVWTPKAALTIDITIG